MNKGFCSRDFTCSLFYFSTNLLLVLKVNVFGHIVRESFRLLYIKYWILVYKDIYILVIYSNTQKIYNFLKIGKDFSLTIEHDRELDHFPDSFVGPKGSVYCRVVFPRPNGFTGTVTKVPFNVTGRSLLDSQWCLYWMFTNVKNPLI